MMSGHFDIFVEALQALDNQDYSQAFKLLNALAHQQYIPAFNNLGALYENGMGTEADLRKALFWYKRGWRAAQDTGSCLNIADLYAKQDNQRQASYWWNRAIAVGDGEAALEYAKFILSRRGQENERARQKVQHFLNMSLELGWLDEKNQQEVNTLLAQLSVPVA